MTADPPAVIGVDIGGTKIAAAIVCAGVIHDRVVIPTPRSGSANVMAAVADVVRSLATSAGPVRAIGVGAPGVIDHATGAVTSATDILLGWAGTPVREELQHRTGLPVAVDNDVRMMARAEIVPVMAQGARDVLFVSIGTGVGGAIARGGTVICGPHGCAGAVAHLLVPASGAIACGCGRFDHVESIAAGPAIVAEYGRRTGTSVQDLREVISRGASGDPDAVTVVHAAGALLGRALAGLVSAIDVDAVIVGGGVAQIGAAFIDPLRRALAAEVLAPAREVPVVTARFGTDAPLLGAALFAGDQIACVSQEVAK